jgi:hypothetical protein
MVDKRTARSLRRDRAILCVFNASFILHFAVVLPKGKIKSKKRAELGEEGRGKDNGGRGKPSPYDDAPILLF